MRHHRKDGFRWHDLVLPAETNEARTAYVLREAEWIEVALTQLAVVYRR
jgi:hypothetical protein